VDEYPSNCWVCKKTGHLSRDCPDKANQKTVCFGSGVERHIRPNCPEKDQANVAEAGLVLTGHPYKKVGRVNGKEVDMLLDTGSHYSLIKENVATMYGLRVSPSARSLYRKYHRAVGEYRG